MLEIRYHSLDRRRVGVLEWIDAYGVQSSGGRYVHGLDDVRNDRHRVATCRDHEGVRGRIGLDPIGRRHLSGRLVRILSRRVSIGTFGWVFHRSGPTRKAFTIRSSGVAFGISVRGRWEIWVVT